MLSTNSSNLIIDKEAIKSNLYLLLNTERMSLFGDPYFGTALKRTIFEQSSSVVSDLLIDEIYTTIITFIPQVKLDRRNIVLRTDGKSIFADIYLTYLLDNTSDLYQVQMMKINEGE